MYIRFCQDCRTNSCQGRIDIGFLKFFFERLLKKDRRFMANPVKLNNIYLLTFTDTHLLLKKYAIQVCAQKKF